MEVIILDNGLIGRGSHSYHLAKEVIRSLSKRNIGYQLYGTKSVEAPIVEETGAKPYFQWSLYDHFGFIDTLNFVHRILGFGLMKPKIGTSYTEKKIVRYLNESFYKDLVRLPAEVWQKDNIIVLPGLSQNQFSLLKLLKELPEERRPTVVCQLMFPPSWTQWNENSLHGDRFYRDFFKEAEPFLNKTLFLMTDNNVQHDLYANDYNIETEWLPIPFAVGDPVLKPLPGPDTPLKLGFFGYSKREKGFHLLPAAIELCRKQKQNVEFVIQIQHGKWERKTIDTEETLRKMTGIRVLEGVLSSDDYYREMGNVDILLLPYDPEIYGTRGSAVYTESVAAARPVVATAATSIGQSVLHGDAEGEVFDVYSVEAFVDAIRRLSARFADCKVKALERASSFAQKHSGDSYVDVLLATHAKRIAQGTAKGA